ncbi:MAG: hypothetical protein R6X02_01125 [Enhygromyxa sp.]
MSPSLLARAGPPEPEPETEPGSVAGVWLSLELIGPRGAQIDAAEALRVPPVIDALPRGGAPPPGELVGRVETVEQALRFVEQHAFEGGALGFGETRDLAAPHPGGALLREHGVHLTALVLSGASPSGGTVPYPWPHASELPTPSAWLPASLAVARAPLFAAPSASLPPASERYRDVEIEDAIWQLGVLERCTATGECLRWAQILVREGDRWFGGWIPAAQIVAEREWVAGPDERRFALIPSHRDRAELGYVLLEQRGERREAPRGITHAHADASWPSAGLQLLGDQLLALIDGAPVLTLGLPPIATPSLN